MIEKHYIADNEDFKRLKKVYWTDTRYTRWSISIPTQFPCIAIIESEQSGDLGTKKSIDDYVYLSDFKTD